MHRPSSLEELSAAVAGSDRVRVRGLGSRAEWSRDDEAACWIDASGMSGVIDFSRNDQVVSAKAGTPLADLDAELRLAGQCLPLAQWDRGGQCSLRGTVAGELSLNLPHLLEGQCGSWRDWVLGITIVLADGTVAKSGSHAVKNVAGYDVHKLFIGARGTLGVIAEVILRTFPVKSLPEVDAICRAGDNDGHVWIQRVLRTDFERAVAGSEGIDDPATSTIIRWTEQELPRFNGDWVMRSNQSFQAIVEASPLMRRTKQALDPTGKFLF